MLSLLELDHILIYPALTTGFSNSNLTQTTFPIARKAMSRISRITEPYLVIRQSLQPLQLSRWQLVKLFVKTSVLGMPRGLVMFLLAVVVILYVVFKTSKQRVVMPRELPVVKKDSTHFEDVIAEGRKKVS